MNISHYCSKCDAYHGDVPCGGAKYKVYACPICLTSPCGCPDSVADYDDWTAEYDRIRENYDRIERENAELARVQRALDETIPKLEAQQWDSHDAIRAHALGVAL